MPDRVPAWLPRPVRLLPRALEKPWGGRRMATVLRRDLPPGTAVGEMWEVHDRDGSSSAIRGGPLDGRTIGELRTAAGCTRRFPLLVKILDASEALSVQVHPDAACAARQSAAARASSGAEAGGTIEAKTECWFVLHAEKGARVWRGLREGVDRRALAEALARGTVEDCLHSFEVTAGDTVFVPAGTVHTIGKGVLLAEVQQNSDTTWRLWDWGRPRTLHVEEALDAIHFGPRSPDKVPAQVIEDDGAMQRLLLVRCPAFAAESLTAMGTLTLDMTRGLDRTETPSAEPTVLHVVQGSGEIRPFRRRVPPLRFDAGDTILLPAEEEAYEVSPGASVVRAFLFRESGRS